MSESNGRDGGGRVPLEVARQRFPPVWTIYAHPRDYPHGYVVRVWYGETPEPQAHTFPNVTEAREHCALCGASMRLAPLDGDDPVIAETWI